MENVADRNREPGLSSNEITFVFIGTQDYHFMILENIRLLRKLYPTSPVLVYDWGDDDGKPSGTTFPEDVEIIDWTSRVGDTLYLLDIYDLNHKIELGKALNSREGNSWVRRAIKFFLKRFPGSIISKRAVERALRYENLLLHKSYMLQDCSERLAGRRFFLLDADAYLVDYVDDIFDENADVILPRDPSEKLCWDINQCSGISTGIVAFGPNREARDAFLSEWYSAIENNAEHLRELAALTRLIKDKAPALLDDFTTLPVNFGRETVRIRMVPNDIYNRVHSFHQRCTDFSSAKIVHLPGIAQRPHLFSQYLQDVEGVLLKNIESKIN